MATALAPAASSTVRLEPAAAAVFAAEELAVLAANLLELDLVSVAGRVNLA